MTLEKDLGDGAGFVPAAGEHVDFTLTDAEGAAHTAADRDLHDAGANTNAAGQCTITFTSPTDGDGDRARLERLVGGRLGAVLGGDRRSSLRMVRTR